MKTKLINRLLHTIYVAALVFFAGNAQAQVDTTKKLPLNNSVGMDIKGSIRVGGFLKPPSDTVKLKQSDRGSIAVKNDRIYVWNGASWQQASSDSAGGGGTSSGNFNPGDLYYNSNVPASSLCDSCPVTKSNLQEAVDGISTAVFKGATLTGSNTTGDPIDVDTINYIATKTDIAAALGIGEMQPCEPSGTVDTNIIATRYALYKSLDSALLEQGCTPPDGTETKVTVVSPGLSITGDGSAESPYRLTNTGSPGSNPFNAYLVTGLVSDVAIPSTGNTVTGTNNTPILQAAINAAADNQLIIVPNGNYLFSTPLDTLKGTKTVNLLILGDTYHNGSDFIIMGNTGGPTENHTIRHWGECVGRVNSKSHGQVAHDTGNGPVWSTYTGTPFKIYNSDQNQVEFNRIKGFKNGIEVIGYDWDGAIRGCEENYISGRIIQDCANGIVLTSLNGRSFVDKTYVTGINGGKLTLRTGLALKIDGYAGAAYNGEIYNGGFRSNEFHVLIERTDSIAEIHGDVTEQLFDVAVEGSAVHTAGSGWKVRSVSPNYVRDPRYTGQGYYDIIDMNGGAMGINAQGDIPLWDSPNGRRYGNRWRTDNNGAFIVLDCQLSKAVRDASPAWINYASSTPTEKYSTITSATYTAVAGEVIQFNNASGTLTLPSASSNIGRTITVQNTHATAALAIANAANYTSIPAGDNMTWRSNGSDWRGIVNAEGTGGGSGGSSQWSDDANGITYGGNVGVRTPSKSNAALALPAGTTTIAPLNIAPGTRVTTPANGDEQNDGTYRLTTINGVTYRYMLVPDNGGTAGQGIVVNQAGNGYTFSEVTTRDVNANYTVVAGDRWIMYNGAVGSFTVTLPTPAGNVGRRLTILKGGTNTVVGFSGTQVGLTSIGAGGIGGITIWCDGNFWRTESKWHD